MHLTLLLEFDMRSLIGTGLTFVLICGTVNAAPEPITPERLIGSWEQPGDKEKKRLRLIVEILQGGKAYFKHGEDSEHIVEYVYKVEGDTLTFTHMTKDGDIILNCLVTKLTPEVLMMSVGGGEKYSFKKVVEVKKERETPPDPKP